MFYKNKKISYDDLCKYYNEKELLHNVKDKLNKYIKDNKI